MLRQGWERPGIAAVLALASVMGVSARPALAAPRKTPVVEAVQRVQPSVVSISSEKKAASSSRWPFTAEENQRPRVNGMGTGVIIDGRGFILTNHHVVDKVNGIEVHLADGSVYPARSLQHDETLDLAVLKVDAGKPLPAVTVGSSADLMVGEDVITIGNAFGYENTVSVGIISALNRNVTLSDEQVYRNLIQTDACINPGNSGGPLINIDGELIGINVAVRAGAQGIGFALPIDDVKRSTVEMMSTRRLTSTWHGLVGAETQNSTDRKVLLADVPSGSPAEAGGFRVGDQLLKIGDYGVRTPIDIERGLLDVAPGHQARVLIKRGGQEQVLSIEPKPFNPNGSVATVKPAVAAVDAGEEVWRVLGLRTTPVNPEYVVAASPKLRGGLYVQAVTPGSLGAQAQIQKGDIVVGMIVGQRHWETIRPDNVLFILRQPELAQSQNLQFYIVRRNDLQRRSLSLAEATTASTRSR
ncbi:trypsin-like peptidase domain-containing protein [Singulisphaera sp. PoT]|uniref:trypsin-like peptidase domain-containing protein n=1 Tax=Singulisphaera sp. PoT TaxID=3411797 RepID=UPI003BF4D73F